LNNKGHNDRIDSAIRMHGSMRYQLRKYEQLIKQYDFSLYVELHRELLTINQYLESFKEYLSTSETLKTKENRFLYYSTGVVWGMLHYVKREINEFNHEE